MVRLTSAAGLVGFLSEPDPTLRSFALHSLNEHVQLLWPEISNSIADIEALCEDESFSERELAALVASKVYYQLGEYNESMTFALSAGKLFDLDHPSEYEDTIIARCIDTYITLSAMKNPSTPAIGSFSPQLPSAFPSNSNGSANIAAGLTSPTTPFSQSALPSKSLLSRQNSLTFDPNQPAELAPGMPSTLPTLTPVVQKNLQAVIRRLFESCYRSGAYQQVVGIAIEARNLDVLREAILKASQTDKKLGKKPSSSTPGKGEELMEYVLDICMNVVQERSFRNAILRLILDLLNDIPNPDYFSIAKCVVYLDQHSMASSMLKHLVERGDGKSLATAYQISFDLYDNGSQEFLSKVIEELPETEETDEEKPATNGSAIHPDSKPEDAEKEPLLANQDSDTNGEATTMVSRSKPRSENEQEVKAYTSIRQILRGTKSIELNLEFLYRSNRTDKSVLNKLRDSLEARNSIFHTGITFANAFMNSGTTNDSFFRENLEWLSKAVNWSKFTATAALGVIHRGNITQGQKLLEPYLPKDSSLSNSVYSQGGSLYALGLIYTNHGHHVLDYLRTQFNKATEEVVQHGGALGLGVAGMGTGSEAIYEDLKQVLYTDSAINGEAVGLAMGLVMLGTGNIKALEDMISYAHDTQHEKIVRGLALGMALVMYARQEAADELISGLLDDPDPTLRYGGIMTIALAYCGTGSNKAVRKLLHVAVSDVSDDVRREAVMSLGFVLFRKPSSVPRMVELLAESYNPHVRYGATMALGIACAGTGLDEAIDLLEPMLKDSVDFVRQGANIALAMILVQQNEAMNPKVATIRKQFTKTISDRHEDAMAKFGCALALGIIDAGGRNCTIGLQTQTGNLNMTAIVGMAVFTQYWYWFPLTHFLSLSFMPTAVIGVDQDLEIPTFQFHSNTRPSMFDYPPEAEAKAEEVMEKIKTAVLSTTAQAKRRRQAKEAKQRGESMGMSMELDPPKSAVDRETSAQPEEAKSGEDEKTPEKEEAITKRKQEKEKVGYELDNMSRVLPAQLKYISFPGERYVPVKKPTGGVILLNDTTPSEKKSLLELKVKKTAVKAAPEMPTNRGNALSNLFGDRAGRRDMPLSALLGVNDDPPEYSSTDRATERPTSSSQPPRSAAADEDGSGEADLPEDFEYISDDAMEED
ncbi:26S proteasome regulatory complex, non-ATPase subcomplex, Rpn2/Psmd1 subunit [Microthyrium microscopicum]|uniref:26S proteasome regulatory subunit RPN2 n=1 Tax=Microthyrium microscopicum TaxID=703497 RepID=A0A6A6U414_9PEZI|nr:26S proteasome regulatory complex, non-ATPase subcomplex, Rpn2/Psmd1 subunit [Microthyrium microscopicum]